MPSTITIASSLGHRPPSSLALLPRRNSRPGCGPSSSASSPASEATGVLVSADMGRHLLSEQVGQVGAHFGDLWRVDPPWVRDTDLDLLDDPARTAAQHDHPVAEPASLADVVGDEQHSERALGAEPVQ